MTKAIRGDFENALKAYSSGAAQTGITKVQGYQAGNPTDHGYTPAGYTGPDLPPPPKGFKNWEQFEYLKSVMTDPNATAGIGDGDQNYWKQIAKNYGVNPLFDYGSVNDSAYRRFNDWLTLKDSANEKGSGEGSANHGG
jgi:hypothetical protein